MHHAHASDLGGLQRKGKPFCAFAYVNKVTINGIIRGTCPVIDQFPRLTCIAASIGVYKQDNLTTGKYKVGTK